MKAYNFDKLIVVRLLREMESKKRLLRETIALLLHNMGQSLHGGTSNYSFAFFHSLRLNSSATTSMNSSVFTYRSLDTLQEYSRVKRMHNSKKEITQNFTHLGP